MAMKRSFLVAAASVGVFAVGVAVGQQDINPKIHPHLAEAQHLISSAEGQVDQAQAAWGDKLGGHAAKAKDLLRQADEELKQAAIYANKYK